MSDRSRIGFSFAEDTQPSKLKTRNTPMTFVILYEYFMKIQLSNLGHVFTTTNSISAFLPAFNQGVATIYLVNI